MTNTTAVRARPGVWAWGVTLLLLASSVYFSSSILHRAWAAERWASVVLAGTMVVAVVVLAGLLLATVVIADEAGLRWRDLGRWRSVSWSGVRDYYFIFAGGELFGGGLIIETDRGNVRFGRRWVASEALQEAVAARATAARATACGWCEIGTRGELELPREFRYSLRGIWVPFGVGVGVPGGVAWEWLRDVRAHYQEMGRLAGAEELFVLGLLFLAIAESAAALCSHLALITYRRRGQRIVVDRDGLRFEDGGTFQIPWEEVTAWRRSERSPLTDWEMVTRRGTFPCGILLGDLDLLNKIIGSRLRGREAREG